MATFFFKFRANKKMFLQKYNTIILDAELPYMKKYV